MADITTPYSSAKIVFGDNVQKWLNGYDALRVAAYQLYEDVYWNVPDTFKLTMRGTNELPIYIPSGRILVNTLNRYVMRGFKWNVDPELGTSSDQTNLLAAFEVLFKREKFMSQFNSNKLYGLIRGDAAWYLSAEPSKPEGSRISIRDVNPSCVFEITDEDDDEIVLGVEIIEQIVSAKDESKVYIKRQSWYKTQCPEHPNYNEAAVEHDGEIAYQMRSLEVDGWEGDKPKNYTAGAQIPLMVIPGITHLPVYRWRAGTSETSNPWGSSVMRGIESLIAAVNGAASDQDLALALSGLGQYVTDAGQPTDDEGNLTGWYIGPGEVQEIPVGRTFKRVDGITSVQPSLDHIKYLEERMSSVHGAGDVAQGKVDVEIAQSGIALQIRMGPILDEAEHTDQEIIDCLTQMFHDLKQWMDVYEGVTLGDAELLPSAGPKLPENRENRVDNLLAGLTMSPPLFSQAYVYKELTRLGWEGLKADEMQAEIAAELEFFAGAADAYAGRINEEADGPAVGADDAPVEE